MTAVHSWTDEEPKSMNSTASDQLEIPPMPEMGSPLVGGSVAIELTMFSAIGLTAGPQYPPCAALPPTANLGTIVSTLTPMSELIVLMRDTPSAPPSLAARAAKRTSATFGVS